MSPPPPSTSTPHLLDLSPSDTLPDHDPLPPTILNNHSSLRPPGGAGGATAANTTTTTTTTSQEHKHHQDNDKEESSERGYPDRSSYQQLPDTPGTPPIGDPFDQATINTTGGASRTLQAVTARGLVAKDSFTQLIAEDIDNPHNQPIIALEPDDNVSDDEPLDLESIRREYRRSNSYTPGAVGRPFVQKDIGVARRAVPAPQPKTLFEQERNTPSFFANRSSRSPSVAVVPITATASSKKSDNIASSHPPPIPPIPSDHLDHHHNLDLYRQQQQQLQQQHNLNEHEQQNASDDSESISELSSISSASMEDEESWISSFCNVVGHEYFAEVSEDFIEDDFNLTGLGSVVPMYKEALEMILDVEPEDDSDSLASASESLSENPATGAYRRRTGHQRTASDYSIVENSAELLYGLIHQRFITSRQGIQVMYEKYLANHFGFCPRVNCGCARVLPCGYSDTPGQETVKLFCPSCCDIYVPPNSRFQSVDGAYFGTTFPSLFLMTFPELDVSGTGKKDSTPSNSLNSNGGKKGTAAHPIINGVPSNNIAPGLGKGKRYEMRIYGFRVNERARTGPRMGWLREKPEDLTRLDEYDRAMEGYDSSEEDHSEIEVDEVDDGEEDEDEEDMGFPGGGGAVKKAVGTRGTKRSQPPPIAPADSVISPEAEEVR